MSNYLFRTATTADIPTIEKLASATWEPTYSPILSKEQIDYMFGVIYTPEALQAQMQEGQTFILLYQGAQPLGFASYSLKDAENKGYKLNKIYLLPECQGKGLGRLLLTHVETIVRELGGSTLDLNVNKYNQAKKFYERCRYHVHHEEDIPIGPYWMNDFVMRKHLK
ncbi:GNAT family N-acetyltransferase [Pontibacter sp. Tf4]|uniref:GNAT family N-acetyltransferase n=1 Tax=Pontibacter sp. Tf4 TaxID=2761620 RepID=UPI00162ABA9E|nr:GNAT family N-acetyltransferase [Pontibacter sp. Tf4]MBB6610944.1 GNAT family N-acetyltransferase [Pontibacter sp. Tf4]